jgi:hypothetical protein
MIECETMLTSDKKIVTQDRPVVDPELATRADLLTLWKLHGIEPLREPLMLARSASNSIH